MKDPADARISVEARHAAAHAMVERARREARTLRSVLAEALAACEARSLDSAEDREAVLERLLAAVRMSGDARFVQAVLGEDRNDWLARLHSHGALSGQFTVAAARLAGGE